MSGWVQVTYPSIVDGIRLSSRKWSRFHLRVLIRGLTADREISKLPNLDSPLLPFKALTTIAFINRLALVWERPLLIGFFLFPYDDAGCLVSLVYLSGFS